MKYESNNFQFEAEMPWESAGEGIVRQIMGYNDNLMMVKVKFETGAIGTPHMLGSWCSDRHVQSDAGGFLINGRNPICTTKVAGSSYL